jgi:hypothetical protein
MNLKVGFWSRSTLKLYFVGESSFIPTTLLHMANPKHTIHVGIAAVGILVGAVLSLFTGDPAVALMFSGGAMSSIGYWLGAAAQRRHG